MRPFLKRLEDLDAERKRPKSRRIAELSPEIETALARGISRADIVEALKAEGIDVTPALLSNYLQRLRGRNKAAAAPPCRAPVTFEQPAPLAGPPPTYPHHDPRRLDEIMRSTPDMKALARLGRNGKP